MLKIVYCQKKRIIVSVLSLLLGTSFIAAAQTVVTSGTTMKVVSGTTVTEDSPQGITLAGTIDNQGTINLKGNLTNNGTASLGTGTFVLNGTSAQTLTGTNNFNNLTVNNAAGVTLAGNTRVDGTLTLTNGKVTLGSYNMTLGPTTPSVQGTTSASAMIVATGIGELRKEFTTAASYEFPVGDNTGTAEYSPVVINFVSGTFGTAAYAGVNLVNDVYPDPNINGDYLKRYWKVTQNNISNFNCYSYFNYADGDVVGNESNIYTVKIAPSPVVTYLQTIPATNSLEASGVASFGTFTGMRPAISGSFTALLQGPFSGSAMSTALNSSGKLPLTQPYNTSPWNYAGIESVGIIPVDVVDWVLVELRQATSPGNASSATVLARKAAFIKSNGSIVDIDGISPVRFYNTAVLSNLYPVVYHRNHLAIMSNNSVSTINGVYSYDFTSAQSQIYRGPSGLGSGNIQIGTGWGMVAGNGESVVSNDIINNNDLFKWQDNFSQINYNLGDYDLNGNINNNDLFIWQDNFSKSTDVPN